MRLTAKYTRACIVAGTTPEHGVPHATLYKTLATEGWVWSGVYWYKPERPKTLETDEYTITLTVEYNTMTPWIEAIKKLLYDTNGLVCYSNDYSPPIAKYGTVTLKFWDGELPF